MVSKEKFSKWIRGVRKIDEELMLLDKNGNVKPQWTRRNRLHADAPVVSKLLKMEGTNVSPEVLAQLAVLARYGAGVHHSGLSVFSCVTGVRLPNCYLKELKARSKKPDAVFDADLKGVSLVNKDDSYEFQEEDDDVDEKIQILDKLLQEREQEISDIRRMMYSINPIPMIEYANEKQDSVLLTWLFDSFEGHLIKYADEVEPKMWVWMINNNLERVRDNVLIDPNLIMSMDDESMKKIFESIPDKSGLVRRIVDMAKRDPKWWKWLNRSNPNGMKTFIIHEPRWLIEMHDDEFNNLVRHVETVKLIPFVPDERVLGVLLRRDSNWLLGMSNAEFDETIQHIKTSDLIQFASDERVRSVLMKRDLEWLFELDDDKFNDIIQQIQTSDLVQFASNQRVWKELISRTDLQKVVVNSCKKRKHD